MQTGRQFPRHLIFSSTSNAGFLSRTTTTTTTTLPNINNSSVAVLKPTLEFRTGRPSVLLYAASTISSSNTARSGWRIGDVGFYKGTPLY